MTTYIAVYLGSVFLALILTPAVIRLAQRIDAVDRPGVRTVHKRPIPRNTAKYAILRNQLCFQYLEIGKYRRYRRYRM